MVVTHGPSILVRERLHRLLELARRRETAVFTPAASLSVRCMPITLLNYSASLLSTQWIINASYNQRLFTLLELTTKYEANTGVVLPNACRRSVRALFLL
jgi:hypothetical protein